MTRNQLHGKTFEDYIKACGLFAGSSDGGRSATATFDIEAKYDKSSGLPTSIKSTGSNTVELADARRFWMIDEPHRMIVGQYKQDGAYKIFTVVHEFIITNSNLAHLRGELTHHSVAAFHNGLLLNHFPKGTHIEARKWAKTQKVALAGYNTLIKLHPKIDSRSQRRLQCSVALDVLIETSEPNGHYTRHTESIGGFPLPQRLMSTAREFNARR